MDKSIAAELQELNEILKRDLVRTRAELEDFKLARPGYGRLLWGMLFGIVAGLLMPHVGAE